jgi:hypothetical protein
VLVEPARLASAEELSAMGEEDFHDEYRIRAWAFYDAFGTITATNKDAAELIAKWQLHDCWNEALRRGDRHHKLWHNTFFNQWKAARGK